jgi:hypothetical protein
MYYNNYDITNLDANDIKAVSIYFSANSFGRASEIGISGATAKSLVDRGYLKVVRKEEGFIPVGNDLYKKVPVSVYEMTCPACDLWRNYQVKAEEYISQTKADAECLIDRAKAKLSEVEALIKAVR